MWTPATRRQHNRDHLRYGSDLSDAEFFADSAYGAQRVKDATSIASAETFLYAAPIMLLTRRLARAS